MFENQKAKKEKTTQKEKLGTISKSCGSVKNKIENTKKNYKE